MFITELTIIVVLYIMNVWLRGILSIYLVNI